MLAVISLLQPAKQSTAQASLSEAQIQRIVSAVIAAEHQPRNRMPPPTQPQRPR